MLLHELFAKLHDVKIVDLPEDLHCVAELTTRLLQSRQTATTFHLTCLLSRVLRSSTFDSFHRQTLLLVGSHAAPSPFGTIFPHLYALLTVSLVLGLSSRLTCIRSQNRSAIRASDTLTRSFACYKFVTYLLITQYCAMPRRRASSSSSFCRRQDDAEDSIVAAGRAHSTSAGL